ncbi:MAG: ribonuclease G, partial [Myxococcaceae bacterium]
MSSILVINAAGRETRVALVENGHIAEFYLERKKDKGVVGNIYKGRVVRVLPGMQAAFVDIGLDKAAFLYVSDVVYDPDFARAQFELTEGEHDEAEDIPELPEEQHDADAVTHHGQTQHEFEVHELAPGELAPPGRRTTGEFPAVRTPTGEFPAITPVDGMPAMTAEEAAKLTGSSGPSAASTTPEHGTPAVTPQPGATTSAAGTTPPSGTPSATTTDTAQPGTTSDAASASQPSRATGAGQDQTSSAGTEVPRTTTGELLVTELHRTTTGEVPLTDSDTQPMSAVQLIDAAAAGG